MAASPHDRIPRLHEGVDRTQAEGRALPETRDLRAFDARQLGAITPDGLPLGLTAAKFWSRSKFKGTAALKRKINPTRVPIEQKESMRWLYNLRLSTELAGAPERCVHVGDRESDI